MKHAAFIRQAQALQAIALLLLLSQVITELLPATALGILLALALRWQKKLPRRRLISLGLLSLWAINQLIAGAAGWLEAASNLVWLLAALRLLEANDRKNIGGSGLLLLLALGLAGLKANGLGASLLAAAAALLVLCSLLGVQQGADKLKLGLFGQAVALLSLALPLAVGLFLLAPRLPALWQMPGANSASTGLSDELDPGSIASLVQSDSAAALLRLKEIQLPPPEARYWRVRVLNNFNGRSWQPGPTAPLERNPLPVLASKQQQRWTYQGPERNTLPWPGVGTPQDHKQRINRNGELLRASNNSYVLLKSTNQPSWQTQPPITIQSQWPLGSNPQLEALAWQWQQQYQDPRQRVAAAYHWFKAQGFEYTLRPGLMPTKASLDAVLFEKKRGFCEHYAAAFAALMRAAAIPARVVIGYQGGEWQPAAGQLQILQRDAHAWVELWLPPGQWRTVDPTAWIAPNRISQGVAASLSARDQQQLGRPMLGWFNQLLLPWQKLDQGWSEWIISFDRAQQNQLLEKWLGPEASIKAIQILAGGLCGLLFLGISLLWRQRQLQRGDKAKQQLDKLLHYLAKKQLRPNPGESLAAFIERAQGQEIKLKPDLIEFQDAYYRMRFHENCDEKNEQERLRIVVKNLFISSKCRMNSSQLK